MEVLQVVDRDRSLQKNTKAMHVVHVVTERLEQAGTDFVLLGE